MAPAIVCTFRACAWMMPMFSVPRSLQKLLTAASWGLSGAVFLNMGRTLFQVRAPEAERGRVLAVNQLGFMATGPLGALLSGFVAGELGPRTALVAFGAGMLALVALVTLASDVARME